MRAPWKRLLCPRPLRLPLRQRATLCTRCPNVCRWTNSLLVLGSRKELELIDVWELDAAQHSAVRGAALAQAYREDVAAARAKGKQGSLLRAFWKMHGRDMLITGAMQCVLNVVQVAPFWVLGRLLKVIATGADRRVGFAWTAILCIVMFVRILLENHFFRIV